MNTHFVAASTGRRLILLATLLVAFGLRCGGLDVQELRGDEAFGYFFSLPSPNEIVEQTISLGEPHPVASYWLLHYWLKVAGASEFALRFAGVWWSVLAVALMVPLASQLTLPGAPALVAVALLALSPYAIWHAQDARMYSMSLALTMASTLLALRWWHAVVRVPRLWMALAYLFVTWLALHTHYFALYVVVAQSIAIGGWAIVNRAWRRLAMWLGMGLLLLLLWLPWLLAAWSILFDYRGNGDSPGLLDALVRAHNAFGAGESVPAMLQVWAALLTLVAMALGAIVLWKIPGPKGRRALWFLTVYWLTPLAATWLSAQNRPIFNERYLVAAVPPVYLLVAAVVAHRPAVREARWPIWAGRVAVVGVVVGMALGFMRQVSDPAFSKTRGWRELAAALEQVAAGVDSSRVRLVQNYPDPTLWYYYQGETDHLVLPPTPLDHAGAGAEVARLAASGVERVALVGQPAETWDPGGIAEDALAQEFTLAASTAVGHWPVSIWLRPPEALEPAQVVYEGGLQLAGAVIVPTALMPGGIVAVHLRWQGAVRSVSEQETVSLQLLNGAGELVAQSDQRLEMASVTTADIVNYAILLPNQLAAGELQLVVIVYDPSQAGFPRRLTVQGADRHLLGTVTVVAP